MNRKAHNRSKKWARYQLTKCSDEESKKRALQRAHARKIHQMQRFLLPHNPSITDVLNLPGRFEMERRMVLKEQTLGKKNQRKQSPDLEDMMRANEISVKNNNKSQMSSISSPKKFSVPTTAFGSQKKQFGSSFKKKTFCSFKKKSFGVNSGKVLKFATKANVKKILTQGKNNSSQKKTISLMEMLSQKKESPPQQQQQSPQQANIPISNANKNQNNKKEAEEIDPLASCANELESLFGPSQQVEKKKMESKFQESMDVDQPSEESLDHLFKSKEEPSSKPFARPSPKQNKPSEASPKDSEDKKNGNYSTKFKTL